MIDVKTSWHDFDIFPVRSATRAEKPFPIVSSYAAAPSYQVGGSSVTRFTHQNSPENSLWRDATSIWPQLYGGHVEDPQHPWPLAAKYTVDITTKRHTHSGDGKCRPCLTCQIHKVQHQRTNTRGSATTTRLECPPLLSSRLTCGRNSGLSTEMFACQRGVHLKTLRQSWKQFLHNLDCPFLPLQAVDFASLAVRSSKSFKIISSLPKRAPNTQYWPLRKASFTPFLAIGGIW